MSLPRLRYLCLFVFLINVCLKSVFITSIPSIVTHDEMYYATEARSVVTSGSDVTGTWRPWQLAPANPIYAELTGSTLVPGFWLFPHEPLLALKFIPILLGSLIPISLGLIIYRLTRDKSAFVIMAAMATVNPWIFQFSRMSFDSLFSTSLYLVGIVLLLYLKRWTRLIALLPFFWGFFQYQGHKPLLLPIVFLMVIFIALKENAFKLPRRFEFRSWLPLMVIFFSCLVLVGSYLYRLPRLSSAGRLSEIALFNPESAALNVDTNRRLSLSNPLISLMENKYGVNLNQSGDRLMSSLDLRWLFVHGNDSIDTFAVTEFGFLYLIDAGLIALAFIWLGQRRPWKNGEWWPVALTLIGTLPNVLKNERPWITFRGSFVIMGLLMLASLGAYAVFSKKTIPLWFKGALMAVYVLSASVFFYHYFFRYPVTASRDDFLYERIVASYVARNPDQPLLLYASQPQKVYESLLVYNQLIKPETMSVINQAYRNNDYTLGTIKLQGNCFDPQVASSAGTLVMVDYQVAQCEQANGLGLARPISLSSIIDSGTRYTIYNDSLCQQFELKPFTHIDRNLFNIEKLSNKVFCEAFFTQPATVTEPNPL